MLITAIISKPILEVLINICYKGYWLASFALNRRRNVFFSVQVRLILSDRPVALTFAVVPRAPPNASHQLICQPSRSETLLWNNDSCTCYVILNSHGDVLDFAMVGGFSSALWQHLEVENSSDCENPHKSVDIVQQIITHAKEQAPLIRQQLRAKTVESLSCSSNYVNSNKI